MSNVSRLKKALEEIYPDECDSFHTIKFLYPMGRLQTLNQERTFETQNIPNDAKLIFLGDKNFSWDSR